MNVPPDTFAAAATGGDSLSDNPRGQRRILAVGLAPADVRQLSGVPATAPGETNPRIETAQTLLDALFITGHAAGENPFDLLIIAAAAEIDHLETAIRSLRRVTPAARIVLLCEPADEAACRAALAWGADDYFLLPLDARDLPRISGPARRRLVLSAASSGSPHRESTATDASALHRLTDLDVPAIPLLAQTELLEGLLDGAGSGGGHGDFATRATESLARQLPFAGTLKFIPADAEPADSPAGAIRQSVAFAGQRPFGELQFTPAAESAAAARETADEILADFSGASGLSARQTAALQAAVLRQAAHWLAAMLGLSQRFEQLRSLAITDELSGAYNRRYFMKFMSSLLEKSRETGARVTLLLFDIDDFKKYNDSFGHAAGDAIIRELIKLLRACTREYDLVARIGGDEFAVVYRDNEARRQVNSEHPRDVLAATERFREAIHNHQWPQICKIKGEISISGGLANFPADAADLESLLAKADEALLKAKAAGKNVILLHAPAPAPLRTE